ncbi:structural protein [Pseudomonas sp. 9Ag]|uniref:structural protein n=1 Tax=Pseudomonas sp. 9Ag TaxID=2653167 RepID=UPI0012F04408|nr:structural protein [Pseudomonas sp. 9Ag]VXD04088.1 Phage capsid and scaffold protein [Pseudomonas sp. 9Ag]
MTARQPRGIRNYNPGNLERNGTRWQGMALDQAGDTRFIVFSHPVWGIRAIARTLITYQDARRARDGSRIDSVREIIERWAPAHENNTGAYAKAVANSLGIGADDETVDVYDYATAAALVKAIVRHENGLGPLPGGNWYGDALVAEGLALAGILEGVRHG